MSRYVPKTYNNRRVLRTIIGSVITLALSLVILFLILFFVFNRYVVDGQLEIPWLLEEGAPASSPAPVEESSNRESPNEDSFEETLEVD